MLLGVEPDLHSTTYAFRLASETALDKARTGPLELALGESDKPFKFYGTVENTVDRSRYVVRWRSDRHIQFPDLVTDDQNVRIKIDGLDATMRWSGARKAFEALRACQDRIATEKGEDGPARRAYKRELEPVGNFGRWITNNDYPSWAKARGLEGITGFRLSVDPTGVVSGCEVIQSSGHPMLDELTCPLLLARAKFTPALDGSGKPVADTYSNRVRWQPPR